MGKHLVIGLGEVGTAILKIFQADGIDTGHSYPTGSVYDYLHVCFPYSNNFRQYVESYQVAFKPKYTIIHSTVPVGISRSVYAIHSPIRGIHPNLYEGILTFEKFIGGARASEVADEFRKHGLKVVLCDKQETTEAMKLFDTQYYLECVRFVQRVKRYCTKNHLDFATVYTIANQTYNSGYQKLGYPEYTRPVLQPIMKEVGGHCLLPNEQLLNENNP